MRNPLVLLLVLVPFVTTDVSRAGPHAGGTLLVHSLDQEYSVGEMYCDVDAPASCESVDTRVESSGPSVWVVYGAFVDAESPRLRGIEFGVTYDSGLEVIAHGSCADLELSQPGWPASGTGTIIVWFGDQSGQLIPAYWFAGYLASLEVAIAFELGPHPENGGHFGDGSVVPVLDEIAGYGVLGFGVDGVAPCPEIRTFTIRADGTGDVPTIQDALNVAATGSVIQLEDGVYRGPGNRDLDFHHTPLTLRSISGNPEACLIDCEGRPGESHRGIRMRWREDTGSLVTGIKFINGYIGPEMSPDVEGAAIKIDVEGSLRIANCIFENCVANTGGAVDAGGLRVEIEDCVFVNNRSLDRGGGGFSGGGEILMKNCRFEGNAAPVEGGGAWFTNATLEMENCTFVGNKAAFGGGMVTGAVTATVRGTTWFDNRAVQSGGGLYCRGGSLVVEDATFSNNRGPRGGAIAARASGSTDLSLRRSIVAFNEGESSIYCGTGQVELRNCDVWSAAGEVFVGCLTEGWEERGNFSSDPLFCDRASGDLRLHENSPCAAGFGRDPIGAWPVGCGSGDAADSTAGALAHENPGIRVDGSEAGSRPSLDQQNVVPILRASPNPFRAGTTIELTGSRAAASSPILLEIFDLSGRLVRRVEAEPASGEVRFDWDGRDESGRSAPAGTYFARTTFGSQTLSLRIVRMG